MPLPEFTRRLCLAVDQTRIGGALHPFILEEFPDQRASRLPLWRFGAWAAAQGWTLPDDFPRVMPPERAAPQAAPVVAKGSSGNVEELDDSVLATPAELVDAFGKWGMSAAWFDELGSHKWLLEARRKKGQGQRGNVIPPLFCPYAVMCGLMGKVRKATRLKPDTAWRTLEHKFPKVHAAFESHDTRHWTGD